jgi:hypothetical protein
MEILFSHMSDELQAGYIECHSYPNGNLAIQLMTAEEPVARLSINVDGVSLEKNEFVAKTYNENEGLLPQFIESGLFTDTGKTSCLGHTTCPIYTYNG